MKAAVKERHNNVAVRIVQQVWDHQIRNSILTTASSRKELRRVKVNQVENLVIDNGRRHEEEVRYHDGVWYRGWLSTVNLITGKWVVRFYDDDEMTGVNFPDKDV